MDTIIGTLRRLSPLQRRIAIEVNNIETTAARLRKVVDDLGRYSEELTADELEDLVRQARGKDRIDRDPVLQDVLAVDSDGDGHG